MQDNFEAGSGKTHNSSEFSSNAKRDAADILTHLKQSYDLEPNQVMSKLFELFTRTLTHLKDPKVFDHWLQYLLSVHGSIDLCEGVQLNRTEDSKNVIEFDGESENAAEVLYAAYREYASLERPLNEEFYAVQLEEITLKAQRLEQKLLEKKIKIQEIVSKSRKVIQALMEDRPKKTKKINSFSSAKDPRNSPSRAEFYSLDDEEEYDEEAKTKRIDADINRCSLVLENTPTKLEGPKTAISQELTAITAHATATSIAEPQTHRILLMEEEKTKTPDSNGSSQGSPALSQVATPRENTTALIKSLTTPRSVALKNAFFERVQTQISLMIKQTIHFSSFAVIVALAFLTFTSVLSKMQLSKATRVDFHLVGSTECAKSDPSGFMKDFSYIQGPALTAVSILALVISIVNYGLRISLENLKEKYSSRWLWGFPLAACVLELVVLILLYKGRHALADFQIHFLDTLSLDCFTDKSSALQIFNEIFEFYGNQLVFTIVSAVLALYQSAFYFCSICMVETMQSFK